jgi:predicted nucleic acid-binding protein
MPKIRVLLDACVLLPYQLADLLLRLADAEMFEPLWSEEILVEVERNLVEKFSVTTEKASRRVGHMRAAFPNARVEGYESLMSAMTNHPKDRHVAAAAVRGGAALIVTANLKDFTAESLSQFDIEAVHPDDFLLDQLELFPEVTMATLVNQRDSYTRPSFTVTQFYLNLRRTVPKFCDAAGGIEAAAWDPDQPLPLQVAADEEMAQAFFPDGEPTPAEPLGAAMLWWTALLRKDELSTALQNLTLNPSDWGDYEEAAELLRGTGLMQFVERCPGADDIGYVKFMPNVDQTMVAFGPALLKQVVILTMVLCPDGWWRAWGLSENYFPKPEEIRPPV